MMKKRDISIIVAVDKNNAIGRGNNLLWHISEDLQHFKKITMGHPVIMGRKTYESIGRPLPGRENIIVTRNMSFFAQGCIVVHSLQEAINIYPQDDVFIIGGGEIYNEAIAISNKMYITFVDHCYDADTFFPKIDPNLWYEASRVNYERGREFEYSFSFVKYSKSLEESF